MPDPRFYTFEGPIKATDAAQAIGAMLEIGSAVEIARAAGIKDVDLAGAVVFLEKTGDAALIEGRNVGICILPYGLALRVEGALARHENPKHGFARLAHMLHKPRLLGETTGVHPTAHIAEGANIHPSAVIGQDATIGPRAIVGPFVVIGPGVVIGADAQIGVHVSISHAIIGTRLIAGPGARIGQAGFGFVQTPDGLAPIPQLGLIMIGDDVRIGANATLDRGSLGDTEIGNGVKIDNLVHIGHNVRVGPNSVLVAQVGVAGSTTIGAGVMIGGQAGIADHLTIGDGAQIAARGGLMRDIPPGEKWGGSPARPVRQWFKETAALERLAAKKRAERDE